MNSASLGDMAFSFMLNQRSNSLRQDMTRLTEELSSGQVADVRQVLGGNQSYLSGLEQTLTRLKGFDIATTEATHFGSAQQLALERTQEIAQSMTDDLIRFSQSAASATANRIPALATERLGTLIDVLNTDIAGRSLFAGTATDVEPLKDSDTLIDALRAAVSGYSTAADIRTAADAWFADPAGFSATLYSGSQNDLEGFRISDDDSVSLSLRADDDVFRNMMKVLALTALSQDAALGLDDAQQQIFVAGLTGASLATQDAVTATRAVVGQQEARIADVQSRNAAELTSTQYARDTLLAADPFETAIKLEDVQFHLQSLYTVTARSSQLSLVNFL